MARNSNQAGVFHVVVALGYLLEYFRYRGVGLLAVALLQPGGAWGVPLSAAGDGLMAVAVVLVHRWAAMADS